MIFPVASWFFLIWVERSREHVAPSHKSKISWLLRATALSKTCPNGTRRTMDKQHSVGGAQCGLLDLMHDCRFRDDTS
jgi:hypothetical protein